MVMATRSACSTQSSNAYLRAWPCSQAVEQVLQVTFSLHLWSRDAGLLSI